jgi:antitoxin FitA
MASITIDIPDSNLQKLQDLADAHGISSELLLCASIDNWLNLPQSEFVDATKYVLNKNAELYRRLA